VTVLIEPASAKRFELREGETIKIATPDGGQGGDFSFIGFDQAVTRNVNGFRKYGRPWLVYSADPGMVLCDGDGVPMMEVGPTVGDGRNDIMYPGCWTDVYADGRPGCRDLISGALGIDRKELTGMLSFFINHEVTDEVYKGLGAVSLSPGDYVSFKALEPVVAAVSACPDIDIEGWTAGPLEVTIT
jgi:uncharacterized protein YcgI (DUF1989 family)